MPLYETLGPDSITYILEQTNLTTCFFSAIAAKSIQKTLNLGKLKNIVLFDPIEPESLKSLQQKGLIIYTFDEVITQL